MNVRFVRPAVLEGIKDQARKREMTYGTVMKYMPHFVHFIEGLLGMNAIPRNPTKGGIVEPIMKNRRKPVFLLVMRPTATK